MSNFKINFWQGKIAEDFTFAAVKKIAEEIADQVPHRSLIVGFDSHFLAEKFAEEVVGVLEKRGNFCFLTERDTPAPVVEWEIKDRNAAGAVMITAPGMPAVYCGIKFVKGGGGEVRKGGVERFDPRLRYLKFLEAQIDTSFFKENKPRILVDPMWGAGRGYLNKFFQDLGCRTEEIHGFRDVLFGGFAPDPLEENLIELKEKLLEEKFEIGIALNSDASSFALMDKAGRYYPGKKNCDALLESIQMCYNILKGRSWKNDQKS